VARTRYYAREDAEACFKWVNGTRLDDRTIRVDWDIGFKENRQYGRGKSGGQVRAQAAAAQRVAVECAHMHACAFSAVSLNLSPCL
jgi:hypothetical protein